MSNIIGNLEIAIDGITETQLTEFMDLIAEKGEEMGYVLVARAYMTTEEEEIKSVGEELKNAKKAIRATAKRERVRAVRGTTRGKNQARQGKSQGHSASRGEL